MCVCVVSNWIIGMPRTKFISDKNYCISWKLTSYLGEILFVHVKKMGIDHRRTIKLCAVSCNTQSITIKMWITDWADLKRLKYSISFSLIGVWIDSRINGSFFVVDCNNHFERCNMIEHQMHWSNEMNVENTITILNSKAVELERQVPIAWRFTPWNCKLHFGIKLHKSITINHRSSHQMRSNIKFSNEKCISVFDLINTVTGIINV